MVKDDADKKTISVQNNKAYAILVQFSKVEQNRCRKYVVSPYFNVNTPLIELFDLMIARINREEAEPLSKEKVWHHLHPDKGYDDIRLRKYFSDLLKLVEGFLAQEVYETNPLHRASYLVDAVSKRRLEKLFNSTIKTAKRLSNRQRYRPASFYFYQYELEKNFYELHQYDRLRGAISNIEDIAKNLDVFYLAEKLRIYYTTINRQYEVSHDYKILFIEEIMQHMDQFSYDDYPPVAIYYQICLSLLDSENEKHYYRLKELLKEYGLVFPKEEAANIYLSALNYCTRKINRGQHTFLREYLDLYRDVLSKQIIIIDEELDPAHFKNVVLAGLRLGEIDWTEGFIHEYKQYLPETQRENAVTFNLAQLYFYKKDFEKVIQQLQFVEYEDLSYNLNSKNLLIAAYYELDEIEPLYSLFNSFRAFLNRHKDTIPERRRVGYLNLIKYARKLTRVMPGDDKAVEKLRKELEEARDVVSIKWLREKLEEMG
jgi:hypothetical protein